MKNFNKALILIIGVGILFNVIKDKLYKKERDEMVIAGHHVDKQPCVSGINELFGSGVDSVKTCDCLLPKFYALIKDDPAKVRKFEEVGFFTLQGDRNDSLSGIFRECVVDNIVDTSYKLDLGKFREPFLQKLRDTLNTSPAFSAVDTDSLSNCIMQHFDGNITIKEYFAEDYLKVEKLKGILQDCFEQSLKRK